MDILRLDKTTFKADALVELDTKGAQYTGSKIWTERYAQAGDFQFKTHRVEEVEALIPEDSLVAIRESDEVMIVENQLIENDADGNPELTITGRSFETFLENRVTLAMNYQKPWPMKLPYTTAEALTCYIWNSIVSTSSQDATRSEVWARNLKDTIPNVRISDSTTFTEPDTIWWLQSGIIYTTVLDFLSLETLGIRNIRPESHNAKIVSVDSAGNVVKTLRTNVPQLRVDIYNGVDRTKNQSAVTPVIFNFDQGHLNDPKYLESIKDYVNHAVVESSVGITHSYVGDDDSRTGLARRSTWLDGGTKDAGVSGASYLTQQKRRGKVELRNRRKLNLLDAEVNPFSPYIYNEHYSLGDKVTVMAQRGFLKTMIVEEFVRTEDRTGETGVPTLAVPD